MTKGWMYVMIFLAFLTVSLAIWNVSLYRTAAGLRHDVDYQKSACGQLDGLIALVAKLEQVSINPAAVEQFRKSKKRFDRLSRQAKC